MEQDEREEHIEDISPAETISPKIMQGQIPEKEPDRQTTQSDPVRPSVTRLWKDIFGNSNHWIAVFTGLLLIVAYYQMVASQEATKAAVKATEISDKSLQVSQESRRISEQALKFRLFSFPSG